jgi:hypothetical protein
MKTYNIRVRADYVGYYKIEAKSLNDAEAMAQQELFNEMNDGVDGVFDFEEYDETEFEAHKELKQWANSLNEKWGKNQ